ncbi:hypothetical protein HanHA89_Chr06g0225231 [Helianthus annuus]|nr:hypothetical protein HanHA89_Chr06g0225231 [Helianthus annuus]
MAEEIVNELNTRTNGEPVEKENPPLKLIAANSMHRIAQTILHTYESNTLEIIEDELFTWLSEMIVDILAACLTNIPQAVIMRCHESVIENRGDALKRPGGAPDPPNFSASSVIYVVFV